MKRLVIWTFFSVAQAMLVQIGAAQTVSGSSEPQSPTVFLTQDDMVRVSRECREFAALSNQSETRQIFESKKQLSQSIIRAIWPVVKSTSGIKGRCVVMPGARACEIAPSIYIEFDRTGPQFFEGDKLDLEFTGPAKISDNRFLVFTGSATFCNLTFHPTSPRFTLVK